MPNLKTMRNKLIIIAFLTSTVLFFVSCTNDKLVPVMNGCAGQTPVWDGEVETIVALSCAYAGCHIGGTSAPGNYLSYSGITSILNNGSFKILVFDMKDNPILGMPPDNAAGPKDLTEDQLTILSCWMEEGFPEN